MKPPRECPWGEVPRPLVSQVPPQKGRPALFGQECEEIDETCTVYSLACVHHTRGGLCRAWRTLMWLQRPGAPMCPVLISEMHDRQRSKEHGNIPVWGEGKGEGGRGGRELLGRAFPVPPSR